LGIFEVQGEKINLALAKHEGSLLVMGVIELDIFRNKTEKINLVNVKLEGYLSFAGVGNVLVKTGKNSALVHVKLEGFPASQ